MLTPTALTAEGTRAFLARANIDPAFAGACHASTGGNPFYLGELARELPAPNVTALGPRTIAAAVKRRLDPEALKLARAVAVLGDGADPATAKALADIEDPDTAARALAAAGVLEHGLTFAHPIVRSAVYADIPREERANAHGRAAALLAHTASPERLAAHLLEASPANDPHTVATLRAAARRARELGGASSAAAYLARALKEPPPAEQRAELLTELGVAESRAGTATATDPPRAGDRARDGRADPHPRRDRARARAEVPGRVRARGADPAGAEPRTARSARSSRSSGWASRTCRSPPARSPRSRSTARTAPRRPASKRSPWPRSRSTRARAATTPRASPTSPAAPWPATCSRPTRWAAATA